MRGRKVEFTPSQIKEMVTLVDEGTTTERLGDLYGCSAWTIRRVLAARIGDLRAYKRGVKVRRSMAAQSLELLGERERYEAGYRMALTHVRLHGLQRARDYCDHALLPWRETGREYPPEFVKLYGR